MLLQSCMKTEYLDPRDHSEEAMFVQSVVYHCSYVGHSCQPWNLLVHELPRASPVIATEFVLENHFIQAQFLVSEVANEFVLSQSRSKIICN